MSVRPDLLLRRKKRRKKMAIGKIFALQANAIMTTQE